MAGIMINNFKPDVIAQKKEVNNSELFYIEMNYTFDNKVSSFKNIANKISRP